MAVTAPTDVTAWIPEVISSSIHDKAEASDKPFTAFASYVPDLEGQPGEKFMLPDLDAVSAAENLAVTTAATDDKITGAGTEVTIKEAVKSVAFYDRTKYATGTDFSSLAGSKVGSAIGDRIELDIAAAAFAGRATAKDNISAALDLAVLRAMRLDIPVRLRKRGLALFGEADVLEALLGDTTVLNAAAFGSDEAIRNGGFSRPLFGITPVVADEGTMPVGAVNGLPQVALVCKGVLAWTLQKRPSTEVERDARGRLTRIVGTALHAEGVRDSAGIVFREIGTP